MPCPLLGRVVRHGKVETEQNEDRADEVLRPTQWQTEHGRTDDRRRPLAMFGSSINDGFGSIVLTATVSGHCTAIASSGHNPSRIPQIFRRNRLVQPDGRPAEAAQVGIWRPHVVTGHYHDG